jgi:hypothetical protein
MSPLCPDGVRRIYAGLDRFSGRLSVFANNFLFLHRARQARKISHQHVVHRPLRESPRRQCVFVAGP